jgi:Fe-S oxidoreductase
LVLTPWHHGMEAAAGPQSLCFSCNACETVCPVSIPLPRLILKVREQAEQGHKPSAGKRLGLRLLESPERFSRAAAVGSLLQKPLSKGDGFIGGPFLPGSDWRHLPGLASRPFRERLSRREREGAVLAQRQPAMDGAKLTGVRVAYFPGCITDRFYPEVGEAAVRLLQAAGCEVVFPPGQACCGLPAANSGDRERAVAMAKATVDALHGVRVDWIVSSSTSCVAAMTQDYPYTLAGHPESAAQSEALSSRIVDLAQFLDRHAAFQDGSLGGGSAQTVTYHDSCQSFNSLGLSGQPRRLLTRAACAEIVEMEDSSVCCGFGGTTSFEHPEVAARIAERKLANIGATGAPTVVADNPGCIMHLRGALHARKSAVRVQHLAEFLASGLSGPRV